MNAIDITMIDTITFAILAVILLIAVISDIRLHKIRNWLTFPAMVVGIAYYSYIGGLEGLLFSATGIALGVVILMPFYFMGGMGAGDVKLMGAVGGMLGVKGVLVAFLCTALVGGIWAIILLTLHGHLKDTVKRYWMILKVLIFARSLNYVPPENKEKMPLMPYGVAIAIGTSLSVLRDVVM